MPESKIPNAIWEGTFTLFGVTLRCYVLDDEKHSRVIHGDDLWELLEVMGSDSCPDELGAEPLEFFKWSKGDKT